ncbi:synapse differentiation-inducing gene protein 1-like [Dysidea avara]|uniref:synapse differentiation-inducing gene protein 1-like n=1 Tax=Dysidea avara TaxID=196820 RepID=UPI00331ACA0F
MEQATTTDQYTSAQPSMEAYPPDLAAADHMELYRSAANPTDHKEYQPVSPIVQRPAPPYAHSQQQSQAATTNFSVVAVAQQRTTLVACPPNHLALSLVNLICCCFPIGIAALSYSLSVDAKFRAGNYEEAKRASNTVRSLNIVGFTVGSIFFVCSIIFVVVSVAVPP